MKTTETVALTGKTYDARKQLKNYGATFDGATKKWIMPAIEWAEFRAAYPILSSGIQAEAKATSAICPRCGTVCYGDCAA